MGRRVTAAASADVAAGVAAGCGSRGGAHAASATTSSHDADRRSKEIGRYRMARMIARARPRVAASHCGRGIAIPDDTYRRRRGIAAIASTLIPDGRSGGHN